MKELSLLDKFSILFDNILEHPLFIILFFVPIIIFFLHKKHGKKIYVIMYFLAIFLVLIIGGNELFKIFDNFMDGLFMVLYFPNFITLFIVIILNALFAFVSIFSSDMHKVNKIINYVFFFIVQSLFILVVLSIRSNDLNIYKDNALYSNSDVLSLMQILIGSFGVQMISLLIINSINRVTSVLDRKESELSKSINEQINNLESSKNIDDGRDVSFINVADKTKTSRPVLKSFKFDLNKLQSIKLDTFTKPKVISPIKLKNKGVSYIDEVVKPRLMKPVVLDSSKFVRLEVDNPKIKNVILNSNDVSYLNEVVRIRKFMPVKIDNMKEIYLNVPVKQVDSLFKKITLSDRDVSYLNEISKDYKFTSIDVDKDFNLDVKTKPYNELNLTSNNFTYSNEIFNSQPKEERNKGYNEVNLVSNDFSYSNEMVNEDKGIKFVEIKNNNFSYAKEVPNKYKIYKLNFDNIVNLESSDSLEKSFKEFKPIKLDGSKASNVKLEVKPKKYGFVALKNRITSYLNEVMKVRKFKPVKLDSEKINSIEIKNCVSDNSIRYDKFIKSDISKPDLMKPMEPIYSEPINETISVENLKIIDMQSMVDVVSKYHFYKGVSLEGVNEDAVDNLVIIDFELLMNVLKKYILKKQSL